MSCPIPRIENPNIGNIYKACCVGIAPGKNGQNVRRCNPQLRAARTGKIKEPCVFPVPGAYETEHTVLPKQPACHGSRRNYPDLLGNVYGRHGRIAPFVSMPRYSVYRRYTARRTYIPTVGLHEVIYLVKATVTVP